VSEQLRREDLAERERAIDESSKCVTCGLCNSVCPTFAVSRREPDGPRGRLSFINEYLLSGDASGLGFLDPCLRCNLCLEPCPTGVDYGAVIRSPALRRTPTATLGDIATFADESEPGTLEERYFRALVATQGRTAPTQAFAIDTRAQGSPVAIVPGPLLATERPDVVRDAAQLIANASGVRVVVVGPDPGTGLLELGADEVFAAATRVFEATIGVLSPLQIVCLDPWAVSAAERAPSEAPIVSWLSYLACIGFRIPYEPMLLVDRGPESLADLEAIAPNAADGNILAPELRAHVSMPQPDPIARAVQLELRMRVADIVRERPFVTAYPLSLIAYDSSEFMALGDSR
jgi:ferredoxin